MKAILPDLKKGLAYLLSFLLAFATIPGVEAWTQSAQPEIPSNASTSSTTSPTYSGQGVPQTTQELDSLVSPIALYPDALVAQILSAATFPDQVAIADNWVQQNKSLTGSALTNAVNSQTWDPSVKALTQFPTILDNMAKNLSWTSQLGDAYHNQSADVMAAVQALRKQAQAAGNLKTTTQQTVTTQTQSGQTVIVIQPANPQVVYIPSYNPTVIYGTPYVAPDYTTGDLVATGLLSFGAGIAVGAMMSGGWGWSSWNCNWYHGGVYYHGGAYYGNAAWHGGYYGGYGNHYGGYNNYNNHYGNNYNNNHYGNNNYAHNTSYSPHNTTVKNTNINTNGDHGASSFSHDANGWGSHSSGDFGGSHSSAFSGWGSHSGGGGGWGSQASSSRGWASRGGGGGWGGGGFRGGGGGFRR